MNPHFLLVQSLTVEVEIVIHVNGQVKDIYTNLLFLHAIYRNYEPQTRSVFLYIMVLVHITILIKINCYFQYTRAGQKI